MELINGENFIVNIFLNFICLNGILNMLKLCNDFGINLFFLMIYLDDEDKLFIDVLIGLIFLYVIIIFLFLGGNILVVLVFVKG